MEEARWECVATASGMTQANIITGRLEAEGIVTRIQYDVAGTIYAVTIDGLGAVRILVPEEEENRARKALSQIYDEADLPWDAPS